MTEIGIACVVEGEGEERALPKLLRRIGEELFGYEVRLDIPQPVRAHRHQIITRKSGLLIVNERELSHRVQLALRKVRASQRFLLVLLDADDDLACEAAPLILKSLEVTQSHISASVVFPTREFEAWFIAAIESLRGCCGISANVEIPKNPEAMNAKGWLSQQMGGMYTETIHQAALASQIDLQAARQARSFDKLWRDMQRLGETILARSATS